MSKVHQSVIVKATTKNTLCTYESITPSLYRFHFIFIMTNVQDSKSYERKYNTVNKNIQKRNRRTQRTVLKAKTRRHLSICSQAKYRQTLVSASLMTYHQIKQIFYVKYKYILCQYWLGLDFKRMSVPLIFKLHKN